MVMGPFDDRWHDKRRCYLWSDPGGRPIGGTVEKVRAYRKENRAPDA
jgi:hypothetical protein